MTLRLQLLLVIVTLARPLIAEAQFVTPLPVPTDTSRFVAGRFQHRFDRALTGAQRDSIETSSMPVARVTALRDSICAARPEAEVKACVQAVDANGIVKWKRTNPVSQARRVLPPRFPGFHRRYDLEPYLDSTSSDGGFALFSRFAANVSDQEAYVTTDVISGLVDRVMFAVNYAAVVVRSDGEGSEADRRAIESQRATVIRMINNGGTVTGRLQLPVHATTGPTFQHASSIYLTAGAIGPAGNVDSLNFAGSAVVEVATGFAVREIAASAGALGQVLAAGRLGYAFSESELLVDTGDRGFGFAQLAVGLVRKGTISLSALMSWTFEDLYDPFAPKLVVNFAAIR